MPKVLFKDLSIGAHFISDQMQMVKMPLFTPEPLGAVGLTEVKYLANAIVITPAFWTMGHAVTHNDTGLVRVVTPTPLEEFEDGEWCLVHGPRRSDTARICRGGSEVPEGMIRINIPGTNNDLLPLSTRVIPSGVCPPGLQ
ncbi:MAG: hypothetical protein V4465_00640 [Patescibacteria group bacterium]